MNNMLEINVGPYKSTQAQRLEIVKLLRKAEFDTRYVTLMHRRVGAPDSLMGRPIDEWMSGLSLDAASEVIKKLQALL